MSNPNVREMIARKNLVTPNISLPERGNSENIY